MRVAGQAVLSLTTDDVEVGPCIAIRAVCRISAVLAIRRALSTDVVAVDKIA